MVSLLDFGDQISFTTENPISKNDLLITKINNLLKGVGNNQDIQSYFKANFGKELDKNNKNELLKVFSDLYFKKYPQTLTKYLKDLNKPIDFNSRKEIYKTFKDDNYVGSARQNIELHKYLIGKFEGEKILQEVKITKETQSNLGKLDLDIENGIGNIGNIKKENNNNNNEIPNEEILLNPEKIKSKPYRVSPRGTTMCSFTARKNLENLGINDYMQGNAKALTRQLEKNGAPKFNDFDSINSHLNREDGNVFDIYPKTKNGHRSICFAGKGANGEKEFFVLDPYYSGGKSTSPVPLNEYINNNNFGGIVVNTQNYNVSNEKFT
ncbi:hypothetical protein H3C61_01130 [Candidatus Gracilibacteria bacterium]|nr:hypothetical protein [Candidatus Gracilibacteria bacterium]